MKIVQLMIENIKNITVAEITPTGSTVIISGENGAGKSAVLDAIWLALDQKGATKQNPDPIKHGEKNAKVVVNLGKYVVTRTWTPTKSYLRIENADGAVFKSPGAMLSSLIGELSFDPQAFSVMNEKDQLNTLMSMIDLPIDIPDLDKQRKELYEARTMVNRDIVALKSQRDAIAVPEDTPDEEISTSNIMDEYQTASEIIKQHEKNETDLRTMKDYVRSLEADLQDLEDKAEVITDKIESADAECDRLEAIVTTHKTPDLNLFKEQLEQVEETNSFVRKKQEQRRIIERLKAQETASQNQTKAIQDIDNQKAEAIRNASMPVPGLSFNEEGVLYKGTLLKGCSAAEQLKVSVAMAMALNPEVRVIRITDGSLLDEHNMQIIEEMAADQDFQVWVERVDSSGKLGIYIEEGVVVADNQPEVAEKDDSDPGAQAKSPDLPLPTKV